MEFLFSLSFPSFGASLRILSPFLLLWIRHILTFIYIWNDLFILENVFFVKMDGNQVKKMEKKKKRCGKLVDLVCTRRFFLYKSSQMSKKRQQVCRSTCWFTLCYCLDAWQTRPNAIKWGKVQRTIADAHGIYKFLWHPIPIVYNL